MTKIDELRSRTVKLLNITRKDINKYSKERKKIFLYYKEDINSDLNEWENYINYLEKVVKEQQ